MHRHLMWRVPTWSDLQLAPGERRRLGGSASALPSDPPREVRRPHHSRLFAGQSICSSLNPDNTIPLGKGSRHAPSTEIASPPKQLANTAHTVRILRRSNPHFRSYIFSTSSM